MTIPAGHSLENGACSVCGALVIDVEDMPLEGNYTYDSTGYLGKMLMLDGVYTGYMIGNQAEAIRIVTDAHTGNKAIEFQKDGYNNCATVIINLTEEQVDVLRNDGSLSFWYKTNGGASLKVNGVAVSGSGDWVELVMDATMLERYATNTNIEIEFVNTWPAASIWIDDIVVMPAVGYTVEHKYGDTVLKSEFIKAEVGSTTKATAAEITGFTAGTIEQTTVAEGNTTVVTINYNRDMLMDTLEHMPLEGNYTYDSTGYLGKMLMLDGVYTGYMIGNQAEAIRIVTDAHTGNKAIEFQKDGYNNCATVIINLTEEQVDVLRNDGSLSFWYKTNGGASLKVNGVAVSGSGDWVELVMDATMLERYATNTNIEIEFVNTWPAASIWIDDIVVAPAN